MTRFQFSQRWGLPGRCCKAKEFLEKVELAFKNTKKERLRMAKIEMAEKW
jgi:hypothetical protein